MHEDETRPALVLSSSLPVGLLQIQVTIVPSRSSDFLELERELNEMIRDMIVHWLCC